MSTVFKEGDLAVIRILNKNFLVRLARGGVLHTNKGFIRHDDVIGAEPGVKLLTNLNKPAWAFEPTLTDLLMNVRRHTNISYPKDAAYVLFSLGIRSGQRVLEAGTGSGALTIALSYAVSPGGRVVTYERRAEFVEKARENVERVGLVGIVDFRLGDLAYGIPSNERGSYDACLLDLPEPWTCLEAVYEALKPGAGLGIVLPTINQVERTFKALLALPYLKPETSEILVRTWDVKPGATRPDFRMIGHTMFVMLTRKLLEAEHEEGSMQHAKTIEELDDQRDE